MRIDPSTVWQGLILGSTITLSLLCGGCGPTLDPCKGGKECDARATYYREHNDPDKAEAAEIDACRTTLKNDCDEFTMSKRPDDCKPGREACKSAATQALKKGLEPRAIDLLKIGCDLGDTAACVDGMALAPKAKSTRAQTIADRACELNMAKGCLALALIYRDGIGREKWDEGAEAAFRRACKLGALEACPQRINQP